MKFFLLILLPVMVLCEKVGINASRSPLPLAFENITRHLFHLETRMFINNYGIDSKTLTWLVLKDLNEKAMPFQLRNCELVNEEELLDSSALVTFNSIATLKSFNDKLLLTNRSYKPLQLFVYCVEGSISKIKSLALDVAKRARDRSREKHFDEYSITEVHEETRYFLSDVIAHIQVKLMDIIQYQYFVVDEAQFVKLLTFVWYSPGKCGALKLVEVNRFSKRSAKWEKDKFSIKKMTDFHGCRVIFFEHKLDKGSYFHWHIPRELAANLNYKHVIWPERKGKEVNPKEWIDMEGDKNCFNTRVTFDEGFNPDKNQVDILNNFISRPVEFSPIRLAVPPGENYSEYEKLQMPFDEYVWALIALTFVTAYLTVLVIIYCTSRSIRDLVFGSNVTTPSLNIIQIFFGVALIVLPRRNFARFLTMSFVLYSLIMRTTWQGKIYEFMQKTVAKPEVQTVDEMIKSGFTFFVEANFTVLYPESEITKRGKVIEEYQNVYFVKAVADLILDQNLKIAVQVDPGSSYLLNKYLNGRFSARIRKETLLVDMCGLKYVSHHHFTGIYDLKTQQLATGGIIPLYRRGQVIEFKHSVYPKNILFASRSGPKVLNMEMLEPGFVIWLASVSFAIAAFLLEWLMTLRDFFIVKFVLLAFFETTRIEKRLDVERKEPSVTIDVTGEDEDQTRSKGTHQ